MKYILAFTILLFACSPQKQLNKAYQKVLSDSTQMEKMRTVIERLWPCIPAAGKPGKTITVTNTVEDTAQIRQLKLKLDSILSNQVITPSTNIDSLKKALIADILKGVHPIVIHDSSFRVDTVPDTRQLQLYQQQAVTNNENYLKEVAKNSDLQKKLFYIRTILFSLIGLIVLGSALKLYLKLKP